MFICLSLQRRLRMVVDLWSISYVDQLLLDSLSFRSFRSNIDWDTLSFIGVDKVDFTKAE
jgi:hypothetical protein